MKWTHGVKSDLHYKPKQKTLNWVLSNLNIALFTITGPARLGVKNIAPFASLPIRFSQVRLVYNFLSGQVNF